MILLCANIQVVICRRRRWPLSMVGIVNVLLVIDIIVLIIFVLLQSGSSAGLSGAISGGAEQLFGKKKARGMDLVLHRGTIVTGALFFLLAFMSAYVL